ncbi:MAG TPA: hypothetical protein DIS79_04465 [Bacteroidetes bacterium]|nr:hypothetical protein [Bacteroidota bacterium]HRK04337.1 hypothetical protein [Chlorobiota bacterium]
MAPLQPKLTDVGPREERYLRFLRRENPLAITVIVLLFGVIVGSLVVPDLGSTYFPAVLVVVLAMISGAIIHDVTATTVIIYGDVPPRLMKLLTFLVESALIYAIVVAFLDDFDPTIVLALTLAGYVGIFVLGLYIRHWMARVGFGPSMRIAVTTVLAAGAVSTLPLVTTLIVPSYTLLFLGLMTMIDIRSIRNLRRHRTPLPS